jgi:hypothetical protein
MVYIIDATPDCCSSFHPEVYKDLNKAVEQVLIYNKQDEHTAYSLSSFSSLSAFLKKVGKNTKYYEVI